MIKRGKTVLQAKRWGIYQCLETQTLKEAAQQIVDEDVSCLAVVDEQGFLVGIVTRVDLLRAYMECDDWSILPISDVMVKNVVTVTPQDQLSYVAELLITKGIHRVVVVQEEEERKKPVAVVSAADLVYHMVKSQSRGENV